MDKEKITVELDDESLKKLKFAITDAITEGIYAAVVRLTGTVTLLSVGIAVVVVLVILGLIYMMLKWLGIHL